MKILALADQESSFLWDYFDKNFFSDIDLIISCGDLKPEYLSFLTTMSAKDVYYVHGNHDKCYLKTPPEGCISLEDKITLVGDLRILGLGGSRYYSSPIYQYTEYQMARRAAKLKRTIRHYGGFDILVTHSPAAGIGDTGDVAHEGFETFNELIDLYHPKLMIHGHVHTTYSYKIKREQMRGSTRIVNAYEKYVITL